MLFFFSITIRFINFLFIKRHNFYLHFISKIHSVITHLEDITLFFQNLNQFLFPLVSKISLTDLRIADYADDIALLLNTPAQTNSLLHSLERAASGIGLYVNADRTEYMCFNQKGDISTLNGGSLKLVDKFTDLRSRVSSTENDINTRLAKAWTAISYRSYGSQTWPMNENAIFFQSVVVLILLYGCTMWTLNKSMEKKLDGNYTRMRQVVLNQSRSSTPNKTAAVWPRTPHHENHPN